MEVILTQDINGLGYKNDTVTVKPGYGRNYLIPQGFAIISNNSNAKKIAENIRQAAHKAEKLKNDAEDLANKIGDLTLNIKTKAGESGKIFGAVTTLQIADALKEKGFDIDRKKIAISGDIKQLGEYKAVIDLHKEVKKEISLVVEAD
ncbi:50S ribosomal protein L9 [Marivirga harenae]|uniref:50S ribosomal protein L9 n=1 Tax=Marivirga harenae TaxID=2010992 RepID=UPI0026E0991A|nr:50S ribosomal protein L9 [Marivirga harenae]WKV11674.1 50S ribosomal protein L9 [Marivirga harenae]|tara:strand:+ start:179094 stop:179537 length:444 start_codon:yes stop_codon:yes gene_type:complete